MDEIVYLTDVEGRWGKVEAALASNARVRLEDGRIVVDPGALLVFGGDATDRGPAGRRIVAALLEAKLRQPGRVVLLAGNRDLNKLRLRVELAGAPPHRTPAEVAKGPRAELLRWILANTMGARDAFAMRAAELVAEPGRSAPPEDDEVVGSFLADVQAEGLLIRYLAQCQLAFRDGATLFVHGAVTDESLGFVPGQAGLGDPARVDRWLESLNAWYARQIDAYQDLAHVADGTGSTAYELLVGYQAPLPGTRLHQASVVYGRLADGHNNPHLPSAAVMSHLRRAGVHRLVVGHTPSGDAPIVLRAGSHATAFELVCADNSYGRLEVGPQVAIRGPELAIGARARLDDGREVTTQVRASLDEDVAPLGSRAEDSGHVVGARLTGGEFYLYRASGGFVVEQLATEPTALAARPLAPPTAENASS